MTSGLMISRRMLIAGGASLACPSIVNASPYKLIPERLAAMDPLYTRLATEGDYGPPKKIFRTTYDGGAEEIRILVPGVTRETVAGIIVFTPDTNSSIHAVEPLLAHWVSHGCVILIPTYRDRMTWETPQDRYANLTAPKNYLPDDDIWLARAQTCSRVLDMQGRVMDWLGVSTQGAPLIAGHGMSAIVAQLLLGLQCQTADGPVSAKDDRFAAGLLMAPYGHGVFGLRETSWQNVDVPLLTMNGGRDSLIFKQDVDVHADPHRLSPPGYKHRVFMPYADHTIYTSERARPGTYHERLFYDLKAVSAAYLRSYLAADGEAYAALSGDFFELECLERAKPSQGIPEHSRVETYSR